MVEDSYDLLSSDWYSGADAASSASDFSGVSDAYGWSDAASMGGDGVGNTDVSGWPSDWYLTDSSSMQDYGSNYGGGVPSQATTDIATSGNWLSDLGGMAQSAWTGLNNITSSPFGKQVLGLGLNYLMNNIGQNKSGSSPDYKPMQSPTQYYNDPYTQAMMAETNKQVMNSGAAKGVTNPNRLATMVADKAYATNLLPYMGLQAGVNQNMNQFNQQGWAANAQQNQNLYGGLGTGINNILNSQASVGMVQELLNTVSQVSGPPASQAEDQGRKDAALGKPPAQPNNPEYMKGYQTTTQVKNAGS